MKNGKLLEVLPAMDGVKIDDFYDFMRKKNENLKTN